MVFISSYAWYFYVLAILVAGGFTMLLYGVRFNSKDWTKPRLITLFGLRFLSIFFLLLLLLNPMLETTTQHLKKPLVVWLQDNSESIIQTKDSVKYKTQWQHQQNRLKSLLGEDYRYETLCFGSKVKKSNTFNFKESKTNYDNVLRFVEQNYASQNLGALILASDGLFNDGANVLYSTYDFTCPLYVVPMGDTTRYPNVAITSVDYNKVVLINTPSPVVVHIAGQLLKGKQTEVVLQADSGAVYRKTVSFTSNNQVVDVPFKIESKTKGIHTYRIRIKSFPDEQNLKDNETQINVKVLDVRQKILLLGNAPHPDLGALKTTLERNVNFEVRLAFAKNLASVHLEDYNLLVLHNLPSKTYPMSAFLKQANEAELPIWYVVGTQTDINRFNAVQSKLKIKWEQSYDNVFAYGATDDANSLFRLPDDFNRFLEQLPPLKVPFGTYRVLENPMPLFKQKIKGIKTEKPLFLIFNNQQQRKAYLLGEGVWQWRLYDWLNNGSHDNFYQLINNVAQYLSVKIKRNRLVVFVDDEFEQDVQIQLKAEFYNEVFQRITTPDITLYLKNKTTGKQYEYRFMKLNDSYRLLINSLPVGEYEYRAVTTYHKKTITESGAFAVRKSSIETNFTQADWQYLKLLSVHFSGVESLYFDINKLAENIKANKAIKSIFEITTTTHSLIDFWWLAALIILLLSAEWFLRKYWGRY